jgi:hypothetical protein
MWDVCGSFLAKVGLRGIAGAKIVQLFQLLIALDWLGDLDSNQGFPSQSRKFYR